MDTLLWTLVSVHSLLRVLTRMTLLLLLRNRLIVLLSFTSLPVPTISTPMQFLRLQLLLELLLPLYIHTYVHICSVSVLFTFTIQPISTIAIAIATNVTLAATITIHMGSSLN